MMKIDRGIETRQIQSVFYEYRNSITIYTEDCDKDKKFYVTLFKRLLGDTDIEINDIHPLGSCDEVVEACQKDKNSNPKLYIIDGDIFNMASPRAVINHLFVLDSYCIENYVIDSDAYYKTYDELDHLHSDDEIRKLVDYNQMMDEAIVPFMDLFRHFSLSKEFLDYFKLKTATCIMNKEGVIDIDKTEKEKKVVQDDILQGGIDKNTFLSKLEEKEKMYPNNYTNLMKYVSGKSYLIPYIRDYTNKKLSLNLGLSKEGWKYLYAKNCKLDRLYPLKSAIVQAVRGDKIQDDF